VTAVPTPSPARRTSSRRTLLLIALVGLAPVIASTVMYLFFPRQAATNYGELVQLPAPEIVGTRDDGQRFRLADLQGKWVIVMSGSGRCEEACQRKLYATRQARTIQGREQDRITRVWLITDAMPSSPEMLAAHPGLLTPRVDAASLAALPGGPDAIYVIDPHGNVVLRYPPDPDIRRLAKDLTRLLRASSIG
jgi:hypothetical protein